MSKMNHRHALTVAASFALAATASGQSFNIDISPEGAPVPPASYAGAGIPGHWTSVAGTQGQRYSNLVDVHGATTGVSFIQIGGLETALREDPAVTGDHAALMNDCLITHSVVENCIFFAGLQPGMYDVIIYARMPAEPTIDSETFVDEETGVPRYRVGGTWTGDHELLVSYSRHPAEVEADGVLGFHSGVPGGGNFTIGAALNGFQIRLLGETPGDVNGDGIVDFGDILDLLAAWGDCPDPPDPCPADFDGNGTVNFADLLVILGNWTV